MTTCMGTGLDPGVRDHSMRLTHPMRLTHLMRLTLQTYIPAGATARRGQDSPAVLAPPRSALLPRGDHQDARQPAGLSLADGPHLLGGGSTPFAELARRNTMGRAEGPRELGGAGET